MANKSTEKTTEKPKTPRAKRAPKAVKKAPVTRTDDELSQKDIQIKSVVSNIEMLYNTIKDLKRMERYQQISRVNMAQEENFARLASLDKELANEMILKYRLDDNGNNTSRKQKYDRAVINDTDNMLALINAVDEEALEESESNDEVYNNKTTVEEVKVDEYPYVETSTDEEYDIVDLPSGGECYPNKKSKLPVALLTATDENFITSPSLYRDGLIIDCLLKRKIVDKDFDVESMVSGDVDAITYFLRTSSYGVEFPIKYRDPDTDEIFEAVIDLSQIKMKDFKLKGDENGWFDFETPVRKDKLKFRFLTRKDEKKLEKLLELDNKPTKAARLREIAKYLDAMLDEQTGIEDEDDVFKLEDAIPVMEEWANKIDEKEGVQVNRMLTNRLELMIMSVNGNTDKKFVKKYVRNMPAKDALEFRKYVTKHVPGLDFSIKVEKPESLGGGYVETFLEWDDNVFLNIT